MRAVCSTDIFGKKLALVSRGVSARSTIQLLGGILLEAEDGALRLSATDMEISIQTSSPAEVEGEGRVVIPARIFNDIVRSLPAGNFTLEHDGSEGTVRLAAGENEYTIRAYAADDYPRLPEFDAEGSFRMPGDSLVETVENQIDKRRKAAKEGEQESTHAGLPIGPLPYPENHTGVTAGMPGRSTILAGWERSWSE